MLQAAKRKRGAQPGNFNALKHGRRSARMRAERRQAYQAEHEARRAREKAWADAQPPTDYGAICDAIKLHSEQPACRLKAASIPTKH